MIMWYHLTVGVQEEVHREQPTVDTVFDHLSVPSPEGGVADCETSRGTLAVIFTFGMDSGLKFVVGSC